MYRRSDLQELSKKVHDFVNEYFNFHDGAVVSHTLDLYMAFAYCLSGLCK